MTEEKKENRHRAGGVSTSLTGVWAKSAENAIARKRGLTYLEGGGGLSYSAAPLAYVD